MVRLEISEGQITLKLDSVDDLADLVGCTNQAAPWYRETGNEVQASKAQKLNSQLRHAWFVAGREGVK